MQAFKRNNRTIEWNPANPVITCLMSVYNGETYLREALDSILDQTYSNFEFLIINDGSTDDTVPIIESYDDPRIRLIHNNENIGLTKSLNKGIDLAKGEYIARMDADDVSQEFRFLETLNQFTDNTCLVAEFDNELKNKNTNNLKFETIFNNKIKHSSACFKNKWKYDEKFEYSQDFALWLSRLKAEGEWKSLPNNTVYIRLHGKQIGHNRKKEQKYYFKKAVLKYFYETNKVDNVLINFHLRIGNNMDRYNYYDIDNIKFTLGKIGLVLREKGFQGYVVKYLLNKKYVELLGRTKYFNNKQILKSYINII